jgi:hypothetical protein
MTVTPSVQESHDVQWTIEFEARCFEFLNTRTKTYLAVNCESQ